MDVTSFLDSMQQHPLYAGQLQHIEGYSNDPDALLYQPNHSPNRYTDYSTIVALNNSSHIRPLRWKRLDAANTLSW